MRISIVTPSYRSAPWLRLCIASVADQQGVTVEHIVQDAGSEDGTLDWLPADRRVRAFVEKDQGMYDAVNRGFRRASGEILAYLNCDEQYLPGGLHAIHECFAAHPELEVVLTDSIVTDEQGNYLCHRFSLVPHRNEMWVRFPVLTSGLFLRRNVLHEKNIWLDPQWRALGDWFWVHEMVKRGVRMAVLPRMTSVFADTGGNLMLQPTGAREQKRKWEMAPRWVKWARHLFLASYRLRLLARGANTVRPFGYALYTLANPDRRVVRRAERPTSFWKGR